MRGDETARTESLAFNMLKLKDDIDSLRANVVDSMSLGDTMFGQYGHSNVSKELRQRNEDLQIQLNGLTKEIDKNQAIVERSNRDFIDVKHTLPEKQPKKILHFIEDYTMALLAMSYLFMTLIGIYYYSSKDGAFDISTFFQAVGYSGLISIFVGMVLYYFC